MNNFQKSLDRYLTTPPDDGFEGWANAVYQFFNADWYYCNEEWIESQQATNLMDILYNAEITPTVAAKMIQRIGDLFGVTNSHKTNSNDKTN